MRKILFSIVLVCVVFLKVNFADSTLKFPSCELLIELLPRKQQSEIENIRSSYSLGLSVLREDNVEYFTLQNWRQILVEAGLIDGKKTFDVVIGPWAILQLGLIYDYFSYVYTFEPCSNRLVAAAAV